MTGKQRAGFRASRQAGRAWVSSLFGSRKPRASQTQSGPQGFRPGLEHLESRQLLSVAPLPLELEEPSGLVAPSAASTLDVVFTVNSFLDTVDAKPGDGYARDASGKTSLRAAIMEANALSGAQTINLPAGTYRLTIGGSGENDSATGDLDIKGQLSIVGAGADRTIIDATGLNDRVMDIALGVSTELRGLKITGGLINGVEYDRGGGIRIDFYAPVTISDCILAKNSAPRTSGTSSYGVGGAICSSGTLTILNSTFENNQASNSGGAVYVGGTNASAIIRDCTFSENAARDGGAISNQGPMTIENSTFTQNTGCGNSGYGTGGALENNAGGDLTLVNCTISGNTTGQSGGGICNLDTLKVINSTITGNEAEYGGGVYCGSSAPTSVENTIIAGNTVSHLGPDVDGTVTSLGHNLIGNTAGSTGFGTIGDLLNVAPNLGPLADNGGPTKTHTLLAGSPAIDAANTAALPATDQRGVARPQGSAADIGAVERIAEDAIRGTVWSDLDSDCTRDAGEPGLVGVTIYLDQNQNGQFDVGERFTATDAEGAYAFADLSSGTYRVAEVVITGWQLTTPAAGYHTVTLAAGETATGKEFGNHLPVLTLVVNGSGAILENAGTSATTATVSRVGLDLSQSLTVSLVSNDRTEATVPATVVIPAGQASYTSPINAVDDTLLDGTQTVTITATALAPPPSLDATFGSGGLASAGVQKNNTSPLDLAVQADGKLLTLGDDADASVAWRLTRLAPDGSPDTTFGTNGIVATRFPNSTGGYPTAMTLQPDGKVVVVGFIYGGTTSYRDWGMARYLPDGSLDASFGTDGLVRTEFSEGRWLTDVDLAPDGKILVSGSSDRLNMQLQLARFNADGTLDTTFGTNGITVNDLFPTRNCDFAQTVKRQNDGKIVLAGTTGHADSSTGEFAILRYNADGTLDTSFAGDGIQTVYAGGYNLYDLAELAIQPDGRILFSGYVRNGSFGSGAVVRLNADGTLDATFDGDGIKLLNVGSDTMLHAMSLDDAGRIIVSGGGYTNGTTGTDLNLARLNPDGSFDTSFGNGGKSAIALQPALTFDEICATQFQSSGRLVALLVNDGQVQVARFCLDAQTLRAAAPLDVNDYEKLSVSISSDVVAEGSVVSVTVTRNNTDIANALTVVLVSSDPTQATLPAKVTIPAWNALATVPLNTVSNHRVDGTHTVTIAASALGYVAGTDTLDVTDADQAGIVVAPTAGLTTTEAGGTATFTIRLASEPAAEVTIAMSSSDTTEGVVTPSSLTFTPANWSMDQTVTITGVNNPDIDGNVAYTIITGAAVSADPTYSGLDGTDVSVTNIDISHVPTANADKYSVDEDQSLSVANPGILANDTGADGGTLTAQLVTAPSNGTLTLNPNGTFTYMPRSDYHGPDSFTYRANNGICLSNPAVVSITVNSMNDAPTAVDNRYTPNEDQPLSVSSPGVLANDKDVDGDALTASLKTGPRHGSLVLNPDGSFVFTPDSNYFTPAAYYVDSFTYNITDGEATRVGVVYLTINPMNDAPVAADDSYSVDEGQSLNISVLRTTSLSMVSEPGDYIGRGLTYELTPETGTFTARITNPCEVTLHYTSSVDNWGLYFGASNTSALLPGDYTNAAPSASFTQPKLEVAGNGRGGNNTMAFGEFTVHEATFGPNGVTVSFAASFSQRSYYSTAPALRGTIRYNAVTGSPTGVLANDYDADADALTAVLVTGPSHGTLSLSADGSVRYTPNAGFSGVDSFTYKANDGRADSNVATVSIIVRGVNNAPVLDPDGEMRLTTIEQGAASNSGTRVCDLIASSGGDRITDPDPGALEGIAVIAADTAHGTWEYSTDGSTWMFLDDVSESSSRLLAADSLTAIRFIPDANWCGTLDPGLTFRAWDRTSGTAGGLADTHVNGGTTAFSMTIETASITVAQASGEIHGTTWNDLDDDGVRDTGEPGLAGRHIYVDQNANGQYDSGEPTKTTAADGSYAFTGLLSGTYTVAEIQQADWAQTFPEPSPVGIERVSVACDGSQGNVNSDFPALSADGRFVAFASAATNLVPDDTNNVSDVFVRDRLTGVTERVSFNPDGTQRTVASIAPSISADGRFVLSVVSPPNRQTFELLLFDRQTRTTQLIRPTHDGSLPNETINSQTLSGDGRSIVFSSDATNIVDDDTRQFTDVFVYDVIAHTAERISVNADGAGANGASDRPSISADGRYVSFSSAASSLVSGDSNKHDDIFVRDRQTGCTTLISQSPEHLPGNNGCTQSTISEDGRFVAFASGASNLVPGDTNGVSDIFVLDRQLGSIDRVSVAPGGVQTNGSSTSPQISGDGRYVTFWSSASNLVPGDTNLDLDAFVLDRETGEVRRINAAADGTQVILERLRLSHDGRYVAWSSLFDRFVLGDTNQALDVFVAPTMAVPPTRRHVVEVPVGQVVSDVDFGNRSIPSELHGTVWNDLDGDGTRDAGEPGLAGVTIYLDENNDGQLDPDELSTVTVADNPDTSTVDEVGMYIFSGLQAGTYRVAEVIRNGWIQTSPNPPAGAHLVTLASGETKTGLDFGNHAQTGPVVANDTYQVDEDALLTRSAPGVLGNDSDPDNDLLSAILVTAPSHGSLTLNANGSFAYQPTANYNGPDSFAYKANDGHVDSNVATVSITVNPINDPPTGLLLSKAQAPENAAAGSLVGLLTTTDPDVGDAHTYTLVTGEGDTDNGTFTIVGNELRTTTRFDFEAKSSYTVRVRTTDQAGEWLDEAFTIQVLNFNELPVAVDDRYSVAAGERLRATTPGVLANDAIGDGGLLSVILATGPLHGSLTLNSDGSFEYTPEADFCGTDIFSYWAFDGVSNSTGAAVVKLAVEPPTMLRDINDGPYYSNPSSLVAIGQRVFFAGTVPGRGVELCVSDGTVSGTQVLKDISTGPSSSSPANLTVVNGTLFFSANDGVRGTELWKSDGTEAGTVRVKDIYPGTNSSSPANLTVVNGTLFFTANDGISGVELWKSDGTEAGTVRVKDIYSGTNSSYLSELTRIDETLFFSANDGTSGTELWKSDGTEAGTVRVKDIHLGVSSSSPGGLTNFNGTLFFRANNIANDWELWRSDGTESGTVRVKDINPGASGASPADMTVASGTLFFTASDGTGDRELWKSDGTEAGTVCVKDRIAGSSNPANLTNVNGTLFFSARDASGCELWRSDGTEAGTVRVKDINPGSSSSPTNLTVVNETLFFTANDGASGTELWKSDGTEAGTVRVKDMVPGTGSSSPTHLTNVNGTLFFNSNNGDGGRALWMSDGTAAGTLRVDNAFVGTGSSSPSSLVSVNGSVFFAAYDDTSGHELWKSDATANGTVRVKDICVGFGSSSPANLTNVNGTLFFAAYDDTSGVELWKSDGTEVGTVRVKDINAGFGSSSPANLTNVNGTLFFTASDDTGGTGLWKSDGTEAGTAYVTRVVLEPGAYSPWNFVNVNGVLFFSAFDTRGYGYELWKSNGTEAGTVRVKDINPGFGSSSPVNLTNVNGTLYFSAYDDAGGWELWKSDGTETGTVRVKDIYPGSTGSSPWNLTSVNGTLFFTADDGMGTELWKSNGTTAGTVLVQDICEGRNSSSPANLTNVNGTLFFTANDGTGGEELWKSNGSQVVRVKDIHPGSNSSSPRSLTNIDGTLFFNATDATGGRELWTSKGTDASTKRIADLAPGSLDSSPSLLTSCGGDLVFSADDSIHGLELWTIPLNASPTDIALSRSQVAECQPIGTVVGSFTTIDPDTGDTFTYSLVSGEGSENNSSFTIDGNQLKTAAVFDFEAITSYSIRVRATDQGGLSLEKQLTITVTDVDEVPPTVVAISPSISNGTLAAGTTSLLIEFSEPLMGGSYGANNVANYQLQSLGPDALLGTADDTIVPLSVIYMNKLTTLSFDPLPEGIYRLTLRDTLTDQDRNALDGDQNGTRGGNWVADFVAAAPRETLFEATSGVGAGRASDIVTGDFNGDGWMDLAVALCNANQVGISLGTASGTFSNLTTYASGGIVPQAVAAGDFNRDGFVDVAVINRDPGNIGILLGTGDGGLRPVTTYSAGGTSSETIVVGDFNGDRIADLVALNGGSHNAAILLGVGNGTFANATTFDSGGFNSHGMATGDFNGDGNLDLAVTHWTDSRVSIFLGTGLGTFGTPSLYVSGGESPSSVAVGDLNADGHADLVVTNYNSNTLGVLLGARDGTFSPATIYASGGNTPHRVAIGDFNADGIMDLAVANFQSDNVGILLGTGSGTFTDATTYRTGGARPTSLVMRDFNADGKADLAVSLYDPSASLCVLHNVYAPAQVVPTSAALASPNGMLFDVQVGGYMAGQLLQGTNNAFDGLNRLQVDGADYAPAWAVPNLQDGGRTLVTPSQTISGLTVSREITVPATGSDDFARTVDVFTNPTARRITTRVRIVGNLGSDGATTVFATSDGDAIVEPTDAWIGTDDADSTGTPAVLHYLHGPGGLQPVSVVRTGDNLEWTYELTVEPGETVRLAHFTIVATTQAEAQASADRLVTDDGFGGEAAAFLTESERFELANFNRPPTDLDLSASAVADNQPAETVVGLLSTIDPDTGEPHTYSLASGTGDTDNDAFTIVGNQLRAKASLNYEAKASYSIRVRTTDQLEQWCEEVFAIAVTDVNEPPTVALANTITSLPENKDTSGPIKVADIDISDDALGTHELALAGVDAAMFEIVGSELYLKAGTLLDYDTNPQLDVTVTVNDTELGSTAEDAVNLSITVTAVTGDIHGTVWNDLDGDGVQDAEEPGRANAQVYLDLNTNGQYDSGEPTTTTVADGSYLFTGLLPGTYTVAEVHQSGWLQTFPSMKPEPIELASVASYGVGASGFSCGASINANGRYVAFESDANNLLLGDTNGSRDIFVYDRQTNLLERVSLASNGSQASGDSYWPSISADGRYVAFYSDASNLVPGDTNGCSDVFVYDRETDAIERVSIASNGSQANDFSRYPSISGDGRYVAFESYAGNLMPGDTNRCGDVFVYDRQTDAIERVSTAFDGSQTAYGSSFPSISEDGRYVAFESCATNLIPGDTNARGDVFVYDRQAHAIKRVSMAFDGSQANDNSSEFSSISADGRYVAFASYATNLVPGDTNGLCDVFVYDQQTGAIERVSTAFDGSQTNGVSWFPSISGDGRYVAFESYSTSLVRGDTNAYSDVFVYDRQADASERVSIAFDGVQANCYSVHPSISADGRYVAFQSAASNLVPRDHNLGEDIFVTQTAPSQPAPHTVILAAGQVAAGINFGNHAQTAPLAADDAHQVDEDTPLVVAASGVLANDTDPDNDLLSAHLVTGPCHGSLTLNADGSFTYQPAANYSGPDSFTYKVFDGHEYSNVASVVITVQPVNDPPTLTLTNQTITLAENASTTSRVKVADIVVNDDALGENELTLAGDDAAMFEIVGSELYLKAGSSLDYETSTQLDVTVEIDDPALGTSPEDAESLSITITDVGPTAEAGGAYTVSEGGTVVLAGSGLAYGGGSEGLAYAWDFDGDGQFDDATGPTPTFPAALLDGPQTITIALQVAEQGESSIDTATVKITNVAPRITELTAPQMSGESLIVTVSGQFQDGLVPDGHTVLIDWGDGTSSPATVDATLRSFAANHTYGSAGQYTVTATLQDDNGGVDQESLSIEVVPYLGAVGFATASLADLTEGERWFCLETTREGDLTVEGLATGGGTLQLELYDVGSPWLSAATVLGNGKMRLDVEASAHERYYLRVHGTGTGVELSVANLVHREGQTIDVFGTAGEDAFTFDPTSQSVTVNGLTYPFTGDVSVHFDGGEGMDSAVLTGSSGDDSAVLTASGGRLTGPGYRVTLANIAQTTVDAGEGTDTVYLNGTEDEDTFTAQRGQATLAGMGYSLKVTGFEAIHGIGAGGGDTAVLRDSAGAERLVARPEDAQLYGQGFYLQAKGFSEVIVHATPGSGDRTEFYDSRGNDTLTASPSTATLAGTGFSLTAEGFDTLVASASGGHDQALLTGSAGRDEFSAYPQYSLLRGEGDSLQVNHFDEVRADGQGGGDVARMYDSLGDDFFVAQGRESRFAGIGFATTAVGFAQVSASALRGGMDTARLQGALGESTVTVTPHAGTLAGPGYACRAEGFASLVDASPTEPQGTMTLTTTQMAPASSMPQPGTLVLSGTKVAPSEIALASGNSAPLLAVPHITRSLRLADAESEAEAGLQVIDKLADAVHAADSAEPSIAVGAALLPSSETSVLVESQERSLQSLYESLACESAKPKASGRKDQEALALVVDRLFESEIWE